MYYDSTPYTPPSSPPSPSSSHFQDSSSPPSSPGHDDPRSSDDDWADVRDSSSSSPQLFTARIDPISGAYRSGRVNKRNNAYSPLHTPHKRTRYRSRSPQLTLSEDDVFGLGVSRLSFEKLDKQRQKDLWDTAVERIFHGGEPHIDLSDQCLEEVSAEAIRDLTKFVLLPEKTEPVDDIRAGFASPTPINSLAVRTGFSRTHTAPASTFSGFGRVGPNGKTMSSNSILGMSKDSMNIFLANNTISRLPVELWKLNNLTILSLRNNCISFIPGEIAQLTELRTLNIANNKLQFIPSELLSMKKLTQLTLFPNPFLPEPRPNREGKLVSETVHKGSKAPPLTELSLRILLSRESPSSATILQKYYELPLVTGSAPAFRDIFNNCVPGSVLVDETPRKNGWKLSDDAHVTGIGICPNPHHKERSIFIHHMEERYTWESSTVSIRSLGGTAAVRWRGCLLGCLDFLGPGREEERTNEAQAPVGDDGMAVDLEESDVIQAVRFEPDAELDFDD